MKNKVLKISVVILLLITLTMTNFIFVGSSLISYAADGVTTSHKNVEFEAYFKDANGNKVSSLERTSDIQEIPLYIRVSVNKEGYFNGNIELQDSNFNLTSSESEFVNKIENNNIYLNQINAGTSAEFEVKVKPIDDENINLDFLNKESKLVISGIYRDSTEKDIKINAERTLTLALAENNDKDNIENSAKIITNKIVKVSGEDKRVIQLSVNMGLKNNMYPIKEIVQIISVPVINDKLPETMVEFNLNTMKKGEYSYKSENGYVEINLKNEPAEDNTVLWKKQGTENIILTYIYDSSVNPENVEIASNETVKLYNDKEISSDEQKIAIPKENIDTSIEVKQTNTESEMYKGKLNSGIDRKYGSTTNLIVNLPNTAEYIKVKEEQPTYLVGEEQIASNTIYNMTVFSKAQFDKIFGEEGKIEIYNQDGKNIATVNKDTQADENGNIVIDYTGKEPQAIEIRTTTPVEMGNIEFKHTKTIKQSDRNIILNATQLDTKVNYEYNMFDTEKERTKLNAYTLGEQKETNSTIKLNNTKTEATLQLDKNSLSTVVANDLEMKVTLKSNSEQYDLYKNPIIKIDLPEQIESININNVNLLYEDELKVVNYYVNGRTIIIELQGEQTQYKEQTIEGANIIIDATINVNKTAIAKDEAITLIYQNENATTYANEGEYGQVGQNISIVAPKDVTAINTIKDLGVETIGQEEQKSIDLQRGADEKQVEVGLELINNNPENIQNVNILGTFPTKSEENNMDIKVVEGINIENATTYYTENENATADLNNQENGWTQNINDAGNVKKYLITMDNMDSQTSVNGTYKIQIPENLEYNKVAKEGYETTYTNSSTGVQNTVKATTIEMQTGVGPKLETELSATVGGKTVDENTIVRNGEVIKYTAKISNTGSEDVESVQVFGKIPEGTKLVVPVDNYEYTGTTYYDEINVAQYKATVSNLKVGETAIVDYEVRVETDTPADTSLANIMEINYLDAKQESNEIKCKTAKGNMRVSVKRVTDRKVDLYELGTVRYFAIIENISDQEQTDVKVKTNMTDNLEASVVRLITNPQEYNPEENPIYGDDLTEEQIQEIINQEETQDTQNNNTTEEEIQYSDEINVGTFKPGEIKILDYTLGIKQMEEDTVAQINFSVNLVNGEDEYTSNDWEDKINSYDISMSMTSNTETKYVQTGDSINYTINIKNGSTARTSSLSIKDEIPSQLSINKILVNGEEVELPTSNSVEIAQDIEANSEMTIEIQTVVNYSASRDQAEPITNKATAYVLGEEVATTNEVNHIIKVDETNEPSQGGDNENNNGGNNSGGEEGNVANGERIISGIAWYDENADGIRAQNERTLNNIKIKLLNVDTNELVKDSSGKELEVTTNENGVYVFSNINDGNYIAIFEYDTNQYSLTKYRVEGADESQNSDVRMSELTIENEKQNVPSTDIIQVQGMDIDGIDIGLIELKNFDLQLDKYVTKILLQNSAGTTTREYNNEKVAKTEIDAKQLNGTTVIIEYQIKVTNVGEVAGYARKIADYIPNDLKFSSELNKDWYESDGALYTTSIANDSIAPGESKILTLTLTKTMTENNTGLVNNTAEIVEDYNELGLEDSNSTPGNKVKDENDYSSADVLLSIRTGGGVYISIGVIIAIIVASGVVAGVIVKKKNAKEDEE